MRNPMLARFDGVPCLIAQNMESRVEASFDAIMQHDRAGELLGANLSTEDHFWFPDGDWREQFRPYHVEAGILRIPVKGVLLHDFPWAFGSFATGYAYIERAVARGLADANVRGIALDVNSCGGQAAGCFDAADRIFAARVTKPIKAFVNEHAFSAGYAIASSAETISIARTGGAGSIGVVMTHVDISKAIDDAGYRITFIIAGKHKVDGNSYEKLPDAVKQRWQADCEASRTIFCDLVARNRGMEFAAVSATEAQCFRADEALDLGLIDAVGPINDAYSAFASDLSLADEQRRESDMTDKSTASAPVGANSTELTAARDNGFAEGKAAGVSEGTALGATAERERISAILGSDEAKGRDAQAHHIAFKTSMSADDAKTMLGASAKIEAKPANALEAAMAGVDNPQVGADAQPGGADAEAAAEAANIVAFMKPAANRS